MTSLPADHPLAGLQATAALASGWPTLQVFRPDEAALLDARRVIEDFLGPLPQADLIEPWDPADPDDPWELRVDLPGLRPAHWIALSEALAALPGPAPVLVPGHRDGEREAWDQGWLVADPLAVDGVFAVRVERSMGGVVVPDLQAARADEAVQALEIDLVTGLQAANVPHAFASDRGPDTVTPVIHRETGRFGVQIAFDDPQAGERWMREQILAVIGRVVHRRANHPVLRLAPDLAWDHRFGLVIVAWIIAPAVPGLPGDAPIEPGITPTVERIPTWLAGLDDLVEGLEVHVVPTAPRDHDSVVDAVTTLIAGADLAWTGGRPRWLVRRDGPVFVPTWVVPAEADADELISTFRALGRVPGVEAVRLVPGEPAGLGEAWAQVRPSWHLGSARWLQRLRDGLTDRDRLPEVSTRRADARDQQLGEALVARIVEAGGAQLESDTPFRPVTDSSGRRGIELRLDASSRVERPLRRALAAIASVEHPDLCTVGWWGYRDGVATAWLAWRR